MEKYDVVVIGAGPGGYPAAIRAAQLGASVAVVEKEALGGTCLNWGCIPTKTLISASSLYWAMRHAGRFGLNAETVTFDYAKMVQNKNQLVEKLRTGIATLLKANDITVYEGTGSLVNRHRITVHQGRNQKTMIEADRTIMATGSTADLPAFLPKSHRIVESRAFLDLPQLPQTLIVMGGGAIGCELACMAAQLGVNVTIVEILDDILAMLDSDLRAVARQHMEKQLNIRFLTGKPAESVQARDGGVTVHLGGQPVDAELLLAAMGRRPMTEGLSLENAGLTPNSKGFIAVDEFGQTQSATIYAVGDVTGGPQLAHAATAQGIRAAEHAMGKCRFPRRQVVPNCIFTAPEIGAVGLSEQEAQQQNRPIHTGKFLFQALGKALASGESTGFVKWIADAETDQLLGAQAIGAHATELIAEATTAIQAELTAAELARTIHAHPTLSEAWMEAAHAVHGDCIHAAPRREKT